nr:hypothetical protein 115 [Pelagibacteraceae bacterium]
MPIIPTKKNPKPYGDGNIGIPQGKQPGPTVQDAINFFQIPNGPVKDAIMGGIQGAMGGIPGIIGGAGLGVAAGEVNRRTGMVNIGDKPKPEPETKPKPEPTVEPTVTSRNVDRNGATGTQMSPSPVKFDGTEGMDAFIKKLQSEPYGITFGGQGGRTPMESTNLPNTSTGKMVSITNGANAGKYVDVNNPDFDEIVRGTKEGGVTGQQTSGGGKTRGITAALADTDGMRSYMDRVIKDGLKDAGAADTGPMSYANDGLDARSRAFLDYDGPGGSMMALRAADAAQNTVFAGGKLYDVSGKNEDGKYNTVNSEMRGYLKNNRNDMAGSQSYKDAFQKTVTVPADAQSPDSGQPKFATRADYQQLSQRDMDGTLVMGEDNKPEPFENNMNRSAITGAPSEAMMTASNNVRFDMQEPPTRGFLPSEEEIETVKRFYLK